MNAFKRAWCYITRRKTKTILLLITFFLIGNLVILGLGISQAATNAKIITRKSMNPVVSYEIDYQGWSDFTESQGEDEGQEREFPKISAEKIKTLAEDKHVKAYNSLVQSRLFSIGFKNVPVGNENEKQQGTYMDKDGNEHVYQEPNVQFIGNICPNMIELVDGTFTIEDGRFYDQSEIDSEKEVCLITKELSELNNLHVGDKIKVTEMLDSSWMGELPEGVTLEDYQRTYEIIGIYSTKRDVDPNAQEFKWMSPAESPKNLILAPGPAISKVNEKIIKANYEQGKQQGWVEPDQSFETFMDNFRQKPGSAVFLLDDPLEVDHFVEEYTPKLDQFTILNANNDNFIKMSRPLDTLDFFSNIVVWIVIINAIVIISLVTALTLKTRQYEMGVLVSLGVSKVKVIAQLFYELILIAVVAFALSAVSGSLVAGKVGEAVLNYQTEANQKYEDQNEHNWQWNENSAYFTEITQEDLLSQYHVTISPKLIGEIYLLGAGVVLLAIIVPSFMIMRLNPKQILLEQN